MPDSERTKETLNEVHNAYDFVSTTVAALADATINLPEKYAELTRIAWQMDQLSLEFVRKFYALTGY